MNAAVRISTRALRLIGLGAEASGADASGSASSGPEAAGAWAAAAVDMGADIGVDVGAAVLSSGVAVRVPRGIMPRPSLELFPMPVPVDLPKLNSQFH
jgi:hypothetical protein